ncbi:MAG: hypothetical protein ACRDD7_12825 [Peptostreptococcaceae bacterium]
MMNFVKFELSEGLNRISFLHHNNKEVVEYEEWLMKEYGLTIEENEYIPMTTDTGEYLVVTEQEYNGMSRKVREELLLALG